MELRSRIETSLGVTLDVETAIGAGTPNDLLRAIGKQLEGTRPGGYWQQSAAASRQADASNLLMGSFEQTTQPGTRQANGSMRFMPGRSLSCLA
jgi:hypothetical protein